jgi:subtilisin family serine protease
VNILGAFASGEGIYSCENSGTSYAAPFAAGVAAQYLQMNPTATPAMVENALITRATLGVIQGTLYGSPNRLLYTNF